MSNKIPQRSQKHTVAKPANPASSVRATHLQQSFSGPVPPPDILNGYDEIIPGAAERILAMAEADALHRRQLENSCIFHEAEETKRGQRYGLAVCIMAFVLCAFTAYIKQPTVASVVGGATIVGLATAFIVGRK